LEGRVNMVKYTIGPKAVGREPKKRSREASPDDPIYKMGWFVGEITMKDFLSKTRKNISEADGNKEDPEDKLGQ